MPQELLITLASKNAGKKYELEHWLNEAGLPIRLVLNEQAEDIDETGTTFSENAILKAKLTPPAPGSALVLGEDSGFGVHALAGSYGFNPFPGLYSNRWMTREIRRELLGIDSDEKVVQKHLSAGILKLMAGKTDRAAAYYCGIALWHAEKGLLFETTETTDLWVIEEERGSNGFGYDPLVCPVINGHIQPWTMAEMETSDKNQISHRGKAFRKVLAYLQQACSRIS